MVVVATVAGRNEKMEVERRRKSSRSGRSVIIAEQDLQCNAHRDQFMKITTQ